MLGLKPLWAWQHMWLVLAGAGDVIVGQQHNIARSPQALTTSIAGVYLSWQSVDATTVLASIDFFPVVTILLSVSDTFLAQPAPRWAHTQ